MQATQRPQSAAVDVSNSSISALVEEFLLHIQDHHSSKKLRSWILALAVTLSSVYCKKMDIEAECQKIYGENLQGVLLRFRRTLDYETILLNEMKNVRSQMLEVTLQTQQYHDQLLKTKIENLYASRVEVQGSKPNFRVYEGKAPAGLSANEVFSHFSRRQDESAAAVNNTPEAHQSQLDEYAMSMQQLKLEEINEARQLGFDQAKLLVKAFINNVGCSEEVSTKVAWTTTTAKTTEQPAATPQVTAALALRTNADSSQTETAFQFV